MLHGRVIFLISCSYDFFVHTNSEIVVTYIAYVATSVLKYVQIGTLNLFCIR